MDIYNSQSQEKGDGNRFGIPSVGCKNRDDLQLERRLTNLHVALCFLDGIKSFNDTVNEYGKCNNQNTTAAT